MQVVSLSYPLTESSKELQQRQVLAIGEFDGIHLGHQDVIQRAIETARSTGAEAAVMTFDPHPRQVLGHSQYAKCLTPLHEKLRLFDEMGLNTVYVMQFDHRFVRLTPSEFIEEILLKLEVHAVVVGFDFTFGYKGSGNPDTLCELGKGRFTVEVVRPFHLYETKVSSTLIRELLNQGDVGKARELLGRFYRIAGTVVHGEGRGRTIGFPTANIEVSDSSIVPAGGVYAVLLHMNGQMFNGVMNIGTKPTFHENAEGTTTEVFLLDFTGDLYEHKVEVDFAAFLRHEQKFSGTEQLISQIRQDIAQAKTIFAAIYQNPEDLVQGKRYFTL